MNDLKLHLHSNQEYEGIHLWPKHLLISFPRKSQFPRTIIVLVSKWLVVSKWFWERFLLTVRFSSSTSESLARNSEIWQAPSDPIIKPKLHFCQIDKINTRILSFINKSNIYTRCSSKSANNSVSVWGPLLESLASNSWSADILLNPTDTQTQTQTQNNIQVKFIYR